MEIVIASFNAQKVHEIREYLKEEAPQIQVLSLFDFPSYKRSSEINGKTFQDRAKEKAKDAAINLNKIVLADESGIVIPALAKSGLEIEKRYCDEKDSPIIQTKKLLKETESLKDLERSAYLECSLALATPKDASLDNVTLVTKRCEGYLAEEEKGKITFAFDTIFLKHDYSKTLGELYPSVRQRVSHRRKALDKIFKFIQQLITGVNSPKV